MHIYIFKHTYIPSPLSFSFTCISGFIHSEHVRARHIERNNNVPHVYIPKHIWIYVDTYVYLLSI